MTGVVPTRTALEAQVHPTYRGPKLGLANRVHARVGAARAMPSKHVRDALVERDRLARGAGCLVGVSEGVLHGPLFVDEPIEQVGQAKLGRDEPSPGMERNESAQSRWPSGALKVSSAIERMKASPANIVGVADVVQPRRREQEMDNARVDCGGGDVCPFHYASRVPEPGRVRLQ
jgi:hypothetical protein